ncbi:UbiX family flavin prenyltransferase [Candidatus Berkiella aquae]|uniref:Flavin prenyltransferase UbiX n=1 Tax=Candidatus Berkiella aquae TaxID=295108 RepID=A0A0Q9YM27_9GAMM|nr:flavin prenyltransferase UbiX [Candidatus Berkiella aquae]MCS5710563.1 UbiX family flavin prenyltransferase [Candidatus Berkiella aquae]
MSHSLNEITLAFAGASGAPIGLRLLEQLVLAKIQISLVISPAGHLVIHDETDLNIPGNPQKLAEFFQAHFQASPGQIKVYGKDQWSSPLASGSSAPKTMIVCPCSTGCLSAIALGASDNLLERAADVVIKEQGKLVLVVREMPLSAIHLEHMLKLARLGVCIMPASPGFYFKPQSVQDLVDFTVARILDQVGVAHQLSQRWGE